MVIASRLVPFLGVQNIIDYLEAEGFETVIKGIAAEIESHFKRWDDFDKCARIPAHSDNGVIELMPVADKDNYGFKYVNGHPANFEKGLQTVTGFGALADMHTGYPYFMAEMTITTALRTAATSALVASYLMPDNATTMAMIGTGCQSEFQALAFYYLCGINQFHIFDTDAKAMDKFEDNINALDLGVNIVRGENAQRAVIGADVITTCTADKKRARILSENMIGQGVHINAIGGDCPGKTEIDPAILMKADIFVEYEPQTRVEGDIQQLDSDHPVFPIWKVMTGDIEGRKNDAQITVFDSVGFALEDFATLRYLYAQIVNTDYCDEIDLLAVPDDPKNLFGMTQ